MNRPQLTRGYGFLEEFLARKRAKVANSLIPASHRKGCILDIGCGTYPFFLTNTDFHIRYGLDRVEQQSIEDFSGSVITIINHDLNKENTVPFKSDFFDIVTMLAVLEHLEPSSLPKILKEIYRVLTPRGIYIITTPAAWTDWLLGQMARLKIVSPVEIDDHKDIYDPLKIISLLEEAGFNRKEIKFGYFEIFMNIWVTATK